MLLLHATAPLLPWAGDVCVPAVAELGPFHTSPASPLQVLPHYILIAASLIFKEPCCTLELSQHRPALFYGVPSPYPRSGEHFWPNAQKESEEAEHPCAGILHGSSVLCVFSSLAKGWVGEPGAGVGRAGWYDGVYGVLVLSIPKDG